MWRDHALEVIRKPLLQIFTHSNESLFNYATATNKIKMFKMLQEALKDNVFILSPNCGAVRDTAKAVWKNLTMLLGKFDQSLLMQLPIKIKLELHNTVPIT